VEEIKRLINESVAVIIGLSEAKSNVLYEAGYSHALKKPTVHVSSTSLEKLLFDVRNWNTLKYSLGQTAKLREPLARRLRLVLH
jgi:nucleoside 2-deoxyribosyltransferase